MSFSQQVAPACLQTAAVVPVSKGSTVSCLNDDRPVTLTSTIRKCFESLVTTEIKKLKENYMVLLPETIPFLAEPMEDECEQVEQQVQTVVQEMENILGEPLNTYF
ncbi:HEAT repeat-containing protein 1-like [Sphaeramia orbicularis]|uniref:HEAT repeat-containing protein 1-like n=1 Tax=Sphaeramia orbicularis TaxID=375764 RepID=UPI00117EED95|nr:HEAT repeat-containing protein 1-like [Sphaeramia orbicularis]